MIIKPLYNNVRSIVFLAEDNESESESEFEKKLIEIENSNKAAKGFRTLFERFSQGLSLTYEMFHDAGVYKGQKFHSFRKGKLRVYCVIDPNNGSTVLLSHVQTKSTNQTKKSDLAEAYRIFEIYKNITEK